jgi:outer membrane receptor protein involved in Fe transport
MFRSGTYLAIIATTVLGGRAARAEPPPPGDPQADEIFDERADKPSDRLTVVRLTGGELAERGAVDLATALALVPGVVVRDAGRAGFNIELRGQRKGAVIILIDGVPVSDPYYGTFDASTIPITDIVQIRVATVPQSPIDGPGGAGGVIEVHTRDAIGPQLVIGRLVGDSLPSLAMTGTARVPLANHLALRLSGGGLGGSRDLELPNDPAIGEARHAVTGAGRLEYRDADRRIVADGFIDDRHYVSPPSDSARGLILLIDRETTARAAAQADDHIGALQLHAQVWTQYLTRRSRWFADPGLTDQQQVEDLKALHSGALALATRPLFAHIRWTASAAVDFEKAVVSNIANMATRSETTVAEAAGELAYARGQLRAALSAGVAIPFEVRADAWPEGKAVVAYTPTQDLELTATAAYKGRIPSLSERFGIGGNPELGPERVAHAELRAVRHVAGIVHLELAPFYTRSAATIRGSLDPMILGLLVNLGTVRFWGVDSEVRVTPARALELGASYEYIEARAAEVGAIPEQRDPIARLPHHRFDAWVQGRAAAGLSGELRVRYAGEAFDAAVPVASYAVVSANLAARLTGEYLGALRIDDLFDARPEVRTGYHAVGRVISLVLQGTWR